MVVDDKKMLASSANGTVATGGYQNDGGGSVTTGIGLPNTDSQRSYSLDGLGNWKKSAYLPEGSTASKTDHRNNNYVNQITQRSVAGVVAATFEYDGHATPSPGNGNLTNDGTLIYQYDALNRLIAVNRVSDGLAIAAYVYDAMNRRVRKTINNGGITGNVPNGTTDCCWMGWQCMEERNPFGGSGSTDTPTKQYVWGTYLDECIQLNLLQPAGPQNLPAGSYYLLQDTLYWAVALTNSSGNIVEAYDTDAYGNTLIFTSPGPDNTWFTDDDLQSSYGANDIIFQGRALDTETQLYYFRTRYYSPNLGRFTNRNPWGFIQGRLNLYDFEKNSPTRFVEPLSFIEILDPEVETPPYFNPDEPYLGGGYDGDFSEGPGGGYTEPTPGTAPQPTQTPPPPIPIPAPRPVAQPRPVPNPRPSPPGRDGEPECNARNCKELNSTKSRPYILCEDLPYPIASEVPKGQGFAAACRYASQVVLGPGTICGSKKNAVKGEVSESSKYVIGFHGVAKNRRLGFRCSFYGGTCCLDTATGPKLLDKWVVRRPKRL